MTMRTKEERITRSLARIAKIEAKLLAATEPEVVTRLTDILANVTARKERLEA